MIRVNLGFPHEKLMCKTLSFIERERAFGERENSRDRRESG